VRSSAIYILDPESGSVTKIADGRSPSWSPSGEWIAFYDSDTNTVSLIRPNGTDRKALRAFEKDESLTIAPVWSPDSQVLLVNKFRDWNNSKVDVYALEVATKKMTKKFKDVPPIFAWAPTE
jgi:Tol biopolymer transport system component